MNDNRSISTPEMLKRFSTIMFRMLPFTTPFAELFDLFRDLSKSRSDLDRKVVQAHTALQQTSQLLAELEDGLKQRSEKLQQVAAAYEKYSKLAQVEEEKAGALIEQIELTVAKGKGKERIISLVLNLLAGIIVFVLGVYFGPKLTQWMGIQIK